MATSMSKKRLAHEYQSLAKTPPPFCVARPLESNLLECHFIMRGPADSPYAGGEYHGTLIFPPQYPFSPPGIKVFTPSGRFQPDRKLCTSFSDFHAGSWNPAWSVSTILTGLLSFMLSDEITTGSIRSSDSEKREFAKSSHAWNLKNAKFRSIFPEYAVADMQRLPNMGEADLGKSDIHEPPLPKNLGNPEGSVDGLADSKSSASIGSGSSSPEQESSSSA
ncbi:MAG: Ubiquitin-conjugating enzyme E2 6 [Cyphobasidiales sp. Tagirdzhanova-0007]|nr:MAG: Ubiquitin-conjugating enzyme E2 6 [Cyphobasidiales sp. Tagirdzhanova-0007]